MSATQQTHSDRRNFAIIAHIDHGKSTLADRIIEHCGGVSKREMSEQILDSMELERERGITIKAQTVRLNYQATDGQIFTFNLIDTPGHVDFSYEVSRSLAACEGALLVVDASQGVEAQSIANCYTAIDLGLTVIPVLNKIDLASAEPERVREEIEDVIGIDCSNCLQISAKTGQGLVELLEAIVRDIPAPTGDSQAPLQALILDSWFDNYLGTIALLRIFQGELHRRMDITMLSTREHYQIDNVGYFTPKNIHCKTLSSGEVGYITASIKDIRAARVGDTITATRNPTKIALTGFKKVQPTVFAGLYPVDTIDFETFRQALQKLSLNDASIQFQPENSLSLGFGFRCGFLGMLHMDIVRERLAREYDLDIIATAPTVAFELMLKSGETVLIENPADFPNDEKITEIREPIIKTSIYVPATYIGPVVELAMQKRGIQLGMHFHRRHVVLEFELPLSEVVIDFFDRLKSVSNGYASHDYEFLCYRTADMCKIDILINSQLVESLASMTHRQNAQFRARLIVEKIRAIIPRQMFDVAIQAAIGSRIICRDTVKALRKNVTAKCYGGDISRKRKLLEKQKEGKKKMKQIGSVHIPQDVFLSIMKVE